MKIKFLLATLLIAFSALAQVEKAVPPVPNPPRLVNDLAGLLSEEQKQYLESKVVAYDDSTSTQIAVVTVPTLNGYAAVDYAVALGRKWGVGGKDNNNGIVILVSLGQGEEDQGRDAFISIGYGLEGAIPDITANTILQAELIPNLKTGDYYRAFDRTIDALIQAAAGEYTAPEGYRDRKEKAPSLGKIILALIILSIILGLFGGGSSGGGGFASRRGYRGFGVPPIIGGGFGGGGFGGRGGGGFGGGGFGGFGGGGFGGGGAGGKW
ncbi:MAG: TPM domain-containing protein [Flavisolibacter sp.]